MPSLESYVKELLTAITSLRSRHDRLLRSGRRRMCDPKHKRAERKDDDDPTDQIVSL